MKTLNKIVFNVVFFIQILLVFLLFVEGRIALPPWLQVAGRLHPLVLHLPIGFLILIAIIIVFQKHLEKNSAERIVHIGLLFTALAASLTALFGFFLSLQGDYGNDAMAQHKITGVILSWSCYGLLLLNHHLGNRKLLMGLGAFTLITLLVTGHTGSVLTHGQNFVMAPISTPKVLTAENASLYEFAVQPILDRKCFSCHNEAKAKGGLIMTSIEKFREGGENGKPWVEGNPAESRMIKAIYLPLDHDEHMPPDGKPQLTAVEIATLEAWIKSGADFEKKLDQFAAHDSLKLIVASFAASKAETPVEKQYSFKAVSADVVENLNTPYRSIFPLYQNSPALQADFFLKESFQRQSLEELKKIADQLVVLNLSKMPVEDKDLEIISTFRNLEVLNLNFTRVQGAGLQALQRLEHLQSLSLAGTSANAKDLESVLVLPNLNALYIWNTKISQEEQTALAKKYPNVEITGNLFSDQKMLKLSKPRLENDGVIRKGELISLKHNMPGVVIRLSRNDTGPDSVHGEVYKEPFAMATTSMLKVKACKEGWYCSDELEVTCFVEGIAARNVELLTPPDKQYPGKGAAGLTDLQKGFADIFKEPSWLGYRDKPFSARFDFGESLGIEKIVISYGRNIGGFIFPPEEVEVWAGDDVNGLKLIKKLKPNPPADYMSNGVEALEISTMPGNAHRFYKLVAKPIAKLPAWHKSKGEKGWFFVDEIFFY